MSVTRTTWMMSLAASLLLAPAAWATIPYTPLTFDGIDISAGVAAPSEVIGKEYSHDFDHTTAGAGGAPDGQQVVAWDGLGGTADGVDFTGTRPDWTPDQEIDATPTTTTPSSAACERIAATSFSRTTTRSASSPPAVPPSPAGCLPAGRCC